MRTWARRRAISAGASAPLLLALCLSACGGSSTRHERNGGNETPVGGTAGVGAAAGTGPAAGTGAGTAGSASVGGNAGTGGNAGSAGACVEVCPDRMLDNFETMGSGAHLQVAGVNATGGYGVPTDPPRGDSVLAFHLSVDGELGGMNLGYHDHFNPFWTRSATGPDRPYAGVSFWARRGSAAGTASLVVAVTGLEQELGNYQADLEAGNPWLAARFPLADQWEQYVANFRDFAPEGPGTVASTWDEGGQVIHFIVPQGEPLDVWIDDIELTCVEDTCE